MTDPVYTEMDPAGVLAAIGPAWPPQPGAACLAVTGCVTGLVAVYPRPGQPGYAYWAVDGCVPPQADVDLSWLAGLLGIDPADPATWVTPVPPTSDDGPPDDPGPYASPAPTE